MTMSETGPAAFEQGFVEPGWLEQRFEYVRPLRPRRFPVEAKVPESTRHLEIRTALYQLLSFFLRGQASVGSDQFMYYDASNPKACLAPDVYLKFGSNDEEITSWKTWERGTPDLAIEIPSRSDAPDEPWEQKLGRYHRLGVRELVRFDPRAAEQLRVWDYVEGDLAERRLRPTSAVPSRVLGAWWVIVPHARWGSMLRVSRDALGQDLIKNELEVEAEARQAAEARQVEAEARQVEAEARVRELEAEVRRLRGDKPAK